MYKFFIYFLKIYVIIYVRFKYYVLIYYHKIAF